MDATPNSQLALFQGILPIQRQHLWKDIAAGVTLAALGIPEVMGYTKISLTPVVTRYVYVGTTGHSLRYSWLITTFGGSG